MDNLVFRNRKNYNFILKLSTFLLSAYLIILSSFCMVYSAPNGESRNPLARFIHAVMHPIETLCDEMLDGFFANINMMITTTLNALINAVIEPFGPSTDYFDNILGLGGDNIIKMITNTAVWFGVFVATIVFVISLLTFLWNPNGSRDTPLQLVMRYLLSMVFIYSANDIMKFFLDYANIIWTQYIMTAVSTGIPVSSDDFFVAGPVESGLRIFDGAGVITLADPGLKAFQAMAGFIGLILTWQLIKGFIRLFIEIVERYIVVMLLYYFFPAAAGTIVSKNSTNILRSYFRMLGAQLFILLTNAIFVKIFLSLLTVGAFRRNIITYVFGIAFLRSCQRIDSYMASMGLNVAQTGSGLLDSMAGSGRMLMNGLRSANAMRHNAAGMLKNHAVATGNMGMLKTAKALNMGFGGKADSPIDTLDGNKWSQQRKNFADIGRSNPGSVNASANDSSHIISDYMKNPNNSDARSAYQALSAESRMEGMNQMLRNNGENGMVIDNIDDSMIGRGDGFAFDAHMVDQNGVAIPDSGIHGNILSHPETGTEMIGEGAFMKTSSSMDTGSIISRDDTNGMNLKNMSRVAGIGGVMNNLSPELKSNINAMRMDGRGNVALLGKDENGKQTQLGMVTKDKNGNNRLYQNGAAASKMSGISGGSAQSGGIPFMSERDLKNVMNSTGIESFKSTPALQEKTGCYSAVAKMKNGEMRNVQFCDMAAGGTMPKDGTNYKKATFNGNGMVGVSISDVPETIPTQSSNVYTGNDSNSSSNNIDGATLNNIPLSNNSSPEQSSSSSYSSEYTDNITRETEESVTSESTPTSDSYDDSINNGITDADIEEAFGDQGIFDQELYDDSYDAMIDDTDDASPDYFPDMPDDEFPNGPID